MPFDTISSSATFTTVERGQFVNVLPDAGSISRVTVTPPSGPVRQFDMQPGQLYTFGALDALTSVAVTLFAGTAKVDTDIPGIGTGADLGGLGAQISAITYSSGLVTAYVEGGVSYTLTYDGQNRVSAVTDGRSTRTITYNGDGTVASYL